MALKRMDNVGIVVDDLGETIDFFRELGLELEGRVTIEGEWAGRITGLADQRVEIAMMRSALRKLNGLVLGSRLRSSLPNPGGECASRNADPSIGIQPGFCRATALDE